MTSVEKIFLIMKERNLSCYRVAKDCGFSEAVFTKWKKGKQQPRRDMLMILANYFNVSVDYLVGREAPANSGSVSGQTAPQTAPDAATSPILDAWAGLDEIQQAKLLAYAKGMIESTNPTKPTPMDIAINQGYTIGHARGREEVEKQQQKKDS